MGTTRRCCNCSLRRPSWPTSLCSAQAGVRPILWAYSLSAAATALIGIQAYVQTGCRGRARSRHPKPEPSPIRCGPAAGGHLRVLRGDQRTQALAGRRDGDSGERRRGVVSGTRGAWVSLAIVAFLFILPRLRPRRQLLAIATMLVVVVLTFQLPGVSAMVSERTETAVSSGGAGRTDIWTVAGTIYGSAPCSASATPTSPSPSRRMSRGRLTSAHMRRGSARSGPHNLVIGTLMSWVRSDWVSSHCSSSRSCCDAAGVPMPRPSRPRWHRSWSCR